MRTLILLTFLAISVPSVSQNLGVRAAKKVFLASGKRLTYGDSIGVKTEFIIKEKGRLSIRTKNEWTFNFDRPGRYTLDSLYRATIQTKEYVKHDSIYKATWYMRCRERFQCFTCNPVRPSVGHSHNIEPTGIFAVDYYRTKVSEPTFRLEWAYPKPYDKQYYIIVWNMFDDLLDVVKTSNAYLDMDLTKYNETAILYRIVSEECVASTQRAVTVETK